MQESQSETRALSFSSWSYHGLSEPGYQSKTARLQPQDQHEERLCTYLCWTWKGKGPKRCVASKLESPGDYFATTCIIQVVDDLKTNYQRKLPSKLQNRIRVLCTCLLFQVITYLVMCPFLV